MKIGDKVVNVANGRVGVVTLVSQDGATVRVFQTDYLEQWFLSSEWKLA